MSTSLIGGVIGAAVGFFTPLGPAIGFTIGSAIGATFAPTEKIQQQPLTDLRVIGTDYGQCIPYVQGHVRIAPQIWWASDRRPVATITESGGKGGGGGVETLSYTYDVDLLLGLTDNEIVGVSRIWDNGKLVYTALTSADLASLTASQNTDLWERLTVYTGTADQLPDPTYEAAVGADNAPAYRHRSYVFIQGFHLGPSGQLRNLTFEVATKATVGETVVASLLYHFNGTGDEEMVNRDGTAQDGGEFVTTTKKFGSHAFHGPPAGVPSGEIGGWFRITDGGSGLFNFGTGDFGIDFWCQLETPPDGSTNNQYATLFTSGGYTGSAGTLLHTIPGYYGLVLRASDSKLVWTHMDSNSVERSAESAVVDLTGEWHHISVQRIDSNLYVTFDGEIIISMSVSATDVLSGAVNFALFLSGSSPPGFYPFHGWLDELRIIKGQSGWTLFPFTLPTAEYTGSDLSGTTLTLHGEDLDDVVSRLSIRQGMDASQFDVTELATITKPVRSLAISQVAPGSQTMELLMSSHYFGVTVSDKVYFRPRGGASVATIPYLELGAKAGGATDGNFAEPFAPKWNSEIELPAQVINSYINVEDDYQTGTEASDRLESALAHSPANVTMALGMTPDEAKGCANTMLWDQVASNASGVISVLSDYVKLEPMDVVTVVDAEGDEHRIRIVRRTDSWPFLELEYVLDDASVLQDQGITDLDYTPSAIVEAAVDTVMELIDGPILRNADDNPGFYVVAKGSDAPYPGSVIMQSNDDTDFEKVATITESGVFGECTTTLGDWTGAHVFDELNSVTVDVGNGTLSSSTRAALIADDSVNAMMIGSEVIQFVTATLVSTGIYKLTRLRRGGRGTEWAMTGHSSDERCVRLRTAGMRRIDMRIDELGDEKFYRGVTIGRRLSTATSEIFTNNAIGLQPFSPTNLRAFQDVGSGDITITCLLRSRLTTRGISTLGQNIPLGEDSAAAELDIAAVGSPLSVVRTLTGVITGTNTGRTATFTYTAAQQATDSTTHGSIFYSAYQLSETVGRGYPLEKAA